LGCGASLKLPPVSASQVAIFSPEATLRATGRWHWIQFGLVATKGGGHVTRAATQAIVVACSTPHIHLWKLRNSTRFTWAKTASHNPGGSTRLWGCQSHRPSAYSPETACPSPCHRRPSRAQFSFEVASKDRSCFHCASTARRAWKQLPDALDKTVVPTMS
jgi:hypothetical protein